jgi:DNA replication protein DnaC
MTNQSTIDKLIEMRLTAMADAFRIQMDDPTMKEVSFEDRFGMLVDIEYSNCKNNRLKRLIRQAEFEQPDASIAAIDYQSGRKLNKALISRLATCEYITEYRNIFITGATGSGKTYMACAFGMERPANTTTQYGMCGFLIYYWTYRLPETAELFQLS